LFVTETGVLYGRRSFNMNITSVKNNTICSPITPLAIDIRGPEIGDGNIPDCSDEKYRHDIFMFRFVLLEIEDMDWAKVMIYAERDNLPQCANSTEIQSGWLRSMDEYPDCYHGGWVGIWNGTSEAKVDPRTNHTAAFNQSLSRSFIFRMRILDDETGRFFLKTMAGHYLCLSLWYVHNFGLPSFWLSATDYCSFQHAGIFKVIYRDPPPPVEATTTVAPLETTTMSFLCDQCMSHCLKPGCQDVCPALADDERIEGDELPATRTPPPFVNTPIGDIFGGLG